MIYNKLVRDEIPRIITENGGNPVTRILTEDEYASALKIKLREEADEFIQSESLEKIGDILEVLRAILCNMNVSFEEAEAARLKKFSERGGFGQRIFLEAVK